MLRSHLSPTTNQPLLAWDLSTHWLSLLQWVGWNSEVDTSPVCHSQTHNPLHDRLLPWGNHLYPHSHIHIFSSLQIPLLLYSVTVTHHEAQCERSWVRIHGRIKPRTLWNWYLSLGILSNWYLSLPSQVLGIISIGQWLVGSVSG